MIPVGARVRCKHEIRVFYGLNQPEDVVPALSEGVVVYRPQDEGANTNFEIGVKWLTAAGEPLHVIEVLENEVDVIGGPT